MSGLADGPPSSSAATAPDREDRATARWIASAPHLPDDPSNEELISSLLEDRGFSTAEAQQRFLRPSAEDLLDERELRGLPQAVDRLARAASDSEQVAVLGDYDVDGITASALLTVVLRAGGAKVVNFVPHRLEDGYGFSPPFVDRAIEAGCSLFVALDCGTNDTESVRSALDRGLDVVVIDHHLPTAEPAEELILVNPKQAGDTYAFKDLCAAGLAFKVSRALAAQLEVRASDEALFRVASLGTIADMVPLVEENRIIASKGLETLSQTRSPGLRALLDVSRTKGKVRAEDVGFRLGPRINAVGRMSDPRAALDLLLTTEPARASALAAELDRTNSQRRAVEKEVFEQALEQVTRNAGELPRFLVASSEGWSRGVLGIAAGKLARRFHRPCLLLAEEDGVAAGSARSVPDIHLHEFLSPWSERYRSFGGHAQALGISFDTSELQPLLEEWQVAAEGWDTESLEKKYRYSACFATARALEPLHGAIAQLEPFGMGNPEPTLRFNRLQALHRRAFGQGHLEVRARDVDDNEVHLLGWGWQERAAVFDTSFDVLGCLSWDDYKSRTVLRLIDARPTEG